MDEADAHADPDHDRAAIRRLKLSLLGILVVSALWFCTPAPDGPAPPAAAPGAVPLHVTGVSVRGLPAGGAIEAARSVFQGPHAAFEADVTYTRGTGNSGQVQIVLRDGLFSYPCRPVVISESEGKTSCVWSDVPPGRYKVLVFVDGAPNATKDVTVTDPPIADGSP